MAHDGRLTDPLHGFAQQPAHEEQQRQLHEQSRFGGTRLHAFSGTLDKIPDVATAADIV
jgi:hypothetical protein